MFSLSWVFGLFGLESGYKVNYDLEFEIYGLCSLCKSILSHLYSCFGLLFELCKKKKNVQILELALR